MAVDAGSIQSSIRIDLNSLKTDVLKVEKVYDDLDANIRKTMKDTEAAVKGVTKVTLQGGISQEAAIKKVIALRKEQIKILQDNAVKNGKATNEELIQIKKLESELTRLETAQSGYNEELKENTELNTKNSSSLAKQALAFAAVALAIRTAKQAISIFAETEQSLANVQAVTNSTTEEFKDLEAAALEAGETTRFTARQAADALFYLSSAGLSAAESSEALGTTLELAGATGSDLAFTAQTLTSTMSQYGIAAEDASRISNVFAAANSNSQATLEKLTGALRQTGAVAGLMNIPIEETVGNLELLFNAGFQGEAAGRALKSALADLGNESSIANTKLSELGISFEDVNPAVHGLTEVIGVLEENNITAAQSLDIFGKVAGPQLATLISAGKDEILRMTEAVTDTDEAARQYAVQNDTLSGSLDKLKSAGEGLAIAISGTLSPIIRSLADTLTPILNIASKLPKVLVAAGTGATVASVGFLALSKALLALGVVITGPLGIIAGVGAVLVGLVSLVNTANDIKEASLAETFGDIAEELGYVGDAIDVFTSKAGNIEKVLNQFKGVERTAEDTAQKVRDIADAAGVTADEVIKIGLASNDVTDAYKEQLRLAREVITELRIAKELSDGDLIVQEKLERRELAKLEAKREQARIEQEALDKVKQQENIQERLSVIKKDILVLDELAQKGAISEEDLLNEKIKLRQEEIDVLLDQSRVSGEVTLQTIEDIAKQKAAIDIYNERLEKLNEDKKELADESTEIVEDSVEDQLDIIEEGAEEEKTIREDVKENWKSYVNTVIGLVTGLINASSNLRTAQADAEIAEINRVKDASLSAIDEETEARLASLGIMEETRLESLQKQLAEAIESGELETASDLQDTIDREAILEESETRKNAIREESEKETAKIRYKADLAAWEAAKTTAIFTGAQAAISAYSSLAPIPVVGPILGAAAAIAAGVLTYKNVAAIDAAKPVQSFNSGGIVFQEPGTALTGDQQNVRANPKEMILTEQQQANLFAIANGAGRDSGGSYHFYLDSTPISAKVVKDINNGKQRLKKR